MVLESQHSPEARYNFGVPQRKGCKKFLKFNTLFDEFPVGKRLVRLGPNIRFVGLG
jgi:hypothetical protein